MKGYAEIVINYFNLLRVAESPSSETYPKSAK